MKKLKITCKLVKNAQTIYYEPIMLDSIVGYAMAREHFKGTPDLTEIIEFNLPFEKLSAEPLVYAATALFPDKYINDVMYLHKRTNPFTWVGTKTGEYRPNTAAGRFQERRIPTPTIVTDKFTAYCIGDKDRLQYYLEQIDFIGKRRNIGLGQIDEWFIEETEFENLLIIENKLTRPIPIELANSLNLKFKSEPLYLSVRPPYWHASTKTMSYNMGDELL